MGIIRTSHSDLALCPKLVLHPAFDAVEHLK